MPPKELFASALPRISNAIRYTAPTRLKQRRRKFPSFSERLSCCNFVAAVRRSSSMVPDVGLPIANPANIADGQNANSFAWLIDGVHQRSNNLVDVHQTEAERALSCSRDEFRNFIERKQAIRPQMSGSQHIPGTEHGSRHAAGRKRMLTLGSDLHVCLHHR